MMLNCKICKTTFYRVTNTYAEIENKSLSFEYENGLMKQLEVPENNPRAWSKKSSYKLRLLNLGLNFFYSDFNNYVTEGRAALVVKKRH